MKLQSRDLLGGIMFDIFGEVLDFFLTLFTDQAIDQSISGTKQVKRYSRWLTLTFLIGFVICTGLLIYYFTQGKQELGILLVVIDLILLIFWGLGLYRIRKKPQNL